MPTGERNLVTLSQAIVKVNGTPLKVAMMDKMTEFVVDSSLSIPDMFSLTFTDDQLTIIESNDFPLGAPVEITMSDNDDPNSQQPVFKGEITAVEPDFEDGTVATITVRGYAKSHRLHRESKTKVWQNVKDSDIAQQIASSVGLSAQISATTEVFKHVFQNALTDMAFLQQRAERIGYEVFVQDNTLYFRKPDPTGGAVSLEWGEELRRFHPRMTITEQVNEVTVKGWDPKKKEAIIGQASASKTAPEVGFGKWGGQAAQSALSAAKKIEVRSPVQSQADADSVAKAILNQINSGFIEAEGEARGMPALKAGMIVELKKLGSKFSGKYKMTSVQHIYTAQGAMITHFTVEGLRPALMTELLATSVEEPRWDGVVTAIVTNNNMSSDSNSGQGDWGLVKVKYPWLDDGKESFWARIAGPGFGAERGIYFMPEVNDEVLIAFEHGDFNRPFIIGGLFNGKDAPPEKIDKVAVSGKVKTRVIRTRTGHTIRFVDQDGGEEYIEIVDAKSNTTIKMDTQQKKITIDSKDKIEIVAQGDLSLQSKTGKVDIRAQQGLSLQGMTVDVKGTSSANVESNGNTTVKGMTFSAQGNTSAEVRGSASLSLQGGIVRIN
ncbi:MAG: VgrG-related protein [Chloroflexi bacterium]|nr:VgrG-related protein [Chloroflexota bacterium]